MPQILTGCAKQASAPDLLELGARDAVARIHAGEMKCEAYIGELVKHAKAHQDLNVFITFDEARVLQEARAVDQARERGETLGAAAGLPFVVKDQIDVAGYPNTAGNAALKGWIPKTTAPVVDSLVKAGGVVLGKANCAEMTGGTITTGVTSSNRFFGYVRNPYDPTRIPGGSSGGNGAAIAARFAPAGIGEDTGGSVRLPAAFCGIAGLRPSTYTVEAIVSGEARKRYSSDGIVPPASALDTFGPMARTVADVAFLDGIITGETAPSVNLRDVSIGIPDGSYWDNPDMDPAVTTAIQAAFAKLRDAGAKLVEVDYKAMADITNVDLAKLFELIAGFPPAVKTPQNDFGAWLAQNAPGVTFAEINRNLAFYGELAALPIPTNVAADAVRQNLQAVAAQYADIYRANAISALAMPTVPILPPLVNVNGDMPKQKVPVNGRWVDEFDVIITELFWSARIGGPGLNVPAGMASGLPVGLQILGLPGDDSRILGLGIAVENVLGRVPAPTFARQNT